jgi:hypothetical protein
MEEEEEEEEEEKKMRVLNPLLEVIEWDLLSFLWYFFILYFKHVVSRLVYS